jgi:hypothetical protein
VAKCDVCGNDYPKAFTIESPQGKFTFDSFECAIHKLAPSCSHCGCKVVGHGVEDSNRIYCCDHCARTTTGDSLNLDARDSDEESLMDAGSAGRWNIPG